MVVLVENDDMTKYKGIREWIERFKELNDGNSPTLREIMAGMGVKSTSHMRKILEQLEEKGEIEVRGIRQIVIKGARGWRK